MINSFKNYIFDLDGTIVNSSEEVLKCFILAFKKANINIDESRLNENIIGPPLKDILISICPKIKNNQEKICEVITFFREIYDFDKNDVSSLYDGVEGFINLLVKLNKNIFVATLKPKIPTERLLKNFGLVEYFKDIYTIDKFGKDITKTEMIKDILNRYKLSNQETVMIGDSQNDMIAGKQNQIYVIGALWGYGADKSNLIKWADKTISNINDIKRILL